jgi:hypothetical protein
MSKARQGVMAAGMQKRSESHGVVSEDHRLPVRRDRSENSSDRVPAPAITMLPAPLVPFMAARSTGMAIMGEGRLKVVLKACRMTRWPGLGT